MARVKTAISVPESLFREIEELSKEKKLSRSQIFTKAAEEYIEKLHNQRILGQLNDVYDTPMEKEESEWLSQTNKNYRGRIVEGQW